MGKLVPVWEIVEKTFAESGIKLSPRLMLKLCDKITKEINQELEEKMKNHSDPEVLS